MAFVHGRNGAVLFQGCDLSSFFNSYDVGQTADTAETTTFGNSSKTYIGGQRDGTISVAGLFDGSEDAVDEQLAAALAIADAPVLTIGMEGTALGKRAKLALVLETSYQVTGSVGDAVQTSSEFQVTGGIANGVFLHALSAETGTVNGTAVDGGASSANGWMANLHVTGVDNLTGATIKVQHSADDDTYTDLGTFDVVDGITSQQISGTGTVNRYVRCIISSMTGDGVTFTVAFARL
jgi:hypothetical protein